MHYVVPPIFLWIPLLRDVLLWTGAVTYSRSRSLDSVILDLLQSNRSVCYCPSYFANVVKSTDVETGSSVIETPCPSDEMFSFARQEALQLVPIVTHGERRRYFIFQAFARLQALTFHYIGYPFPLCFALRIFSKTRPSLLHQQFGPIIECNAKYATNEQLKESFCSSVHALTCSEVGDDEFKLK
jgi:hypothetical protein